MKKVTMLIGAKKVLRRISMEDVSKIYYFKKKASPALPKYSQEAL
jgi:hypothetical protein